MAEPRTARTVKATAPAGDEKPTDFNAAFPEAWGSEPIEVLTGYDIVEKSTLVGAPFLVTEIRFRENDRKVSFVDVTATAVDGTKFMFNDSSTTGIREQVVRYLAEKEQDVTAIVDGGKPYAMRLACMGGLRVSKYEVEVPDAKTGRPVTREASTYYLRLTVPTTE